MDRNMGLGRPHQDDTTNAAPTAPELFEPRSLEWQDNGELATAEVFDLVKRLRAVETREHANELWRLSQKS